MTILELYVVNTVIKFGLLVYNKEDQKCYFPILIKPI